MTLAGRSMKGDLRDVEGCCLGSVRIGEEEEEDEASAQTVRTPMYVS